MSAARTTTAGRRKSSATSRAKKVARKKATGKAGATRRPASKKKTALKKRAAARKTPARKSLNKKSPTRAAAKKRTATRKTTVVKKKAAIKKKPMPRKKPVVRKKPIAKKKVTPRTAVRKSARTKPTKRAVTDKSKNAKAVAVAVPEPPPVITSRAMRYKEAKDAYARSVALLHQKDWAAASRALVDFLSDYSRERELAERARMYLRVCGQHLDTSGEPKSFDDRYYLAVVLSNRGELDRALTVIEMALKDRPGSRKTQYLKASTLALKRSRREALTALARAIELDDQNRIYAANDSDFASLRDDEEFITLTTREDDEDQ